MVENLLHGIRSRVLARHFNQNRVVQVTLGELFDFGRERRREHQILTRLGEKIQNAGNVRQEPHIEHSVGFVENDDLHLRKIHRPAFHVIKQPARRCRENFHAAPQ